MTLYSVLLLALSAWAAPVRDVQGVQVQRAHEAHQRSGAPLLLPAPAVAGLLAAPAPSVRGFAREATPAQDALSGLQIWSQGDQASEGEGLGSLFDYEHAERAPQQLIIPADGDHGERVFQLGRFVGRGETSTVHRLADEPGRVLKHRLPDPFVRTSAGMIPTSWFMDQFIDGHAPLKTAGIPVVDIHDARQGVYAVTDFLDGPLLRDVLRAPLQFGRGPASDMVDALEAFAAKTAAFSMIGDFKSDQLIFDKKRGWTLVDWHAGHQRHDAKSQGPSDVFMNVYQEPAFQDLGRYDHDTIEWFMHVMKRAHDSVHRARRARSS